MDMRTKLFNFYPKRYKLDLFVSREQLKHEEFTYYKSVSTDHAKPSSKHLDLFMMIQTLFFEEEKITFVDAKILVKP